MSATTSATRSATTPVVAPDWLPVDKTAQLGPASYGDPQQAPPPAVVPTAASPFGLPSPVTAPDGGGQVYDGSGAGAWPGLPQSGDGRTWLDRGDGFPQGFTVAEPPHTNAPGMWAAAEPLQTYDHLSQHTDTAGWDQTVPNGRVSARNTFGQANDGNNPTWYGYSENAVTAHLAISAAPYSVDSPQAGTPGFGVGALPTWEMTGGQGNTAYDTPAPPPAGSVQSVVLADPAAGWA